MKILISTILVLLTAPSFCQINFVRKSSWEEIAALAKAEKKLVFLHIEDDKCEQCNEIASKAFESFDLKEVFGQNYISFKANRETEDGRKLAEKFEIKKGAVSLFIDVNGNILNRLNGVAGAGFMYAEQADIALKRKAGKQLSDYVKEYNAGARSQKFLEEYIIKRRQAGMPVDELLEKYTGGLPLDSLNNFRIVKFIYMHGPSVDSRAYKATRSVTPGQVIDSIYKSSPYQEAVAINNAIISTTWQKAVAKKDRNLMYQLASFIQGTYNNDYLQGMIASQRSTVKFLYEIKDTVNYIREATQFLDNTHMRLTADSLKRMDYKLMNPSQVGIPGSKTKQTRPQMPQSHFYHLDLNEHAWQVYQMSSKTGDLERALKWSFQSQEFFNSLYKDTAHPMRLGNAAYIDTYAQLLYKLGRKEEAIERQTKAVEAQKITGSPHASYAATLEKMKDGTLLK